MGIRNVLIVLLLLLVIRFIVSALRGKTRVNPKPPYTADQQAQYRERNRQYRQQNWEREKQKGKPADGNLHVVHVPNKKKKKTDKGDYIDYEEVD